MSKQSSGDGYGDQWAFAAQDPIRQADKSVHGTVPFIAHGAIVTRGLLRMRLTLPLSGAVRA
jgi:hypothetical protein